MPVQNSEIAAILNQVADLLEIGAENPYRVRAYRVAAETINGLSRPAADLLQEGEDLTALEGIGENLAGKIAEVVETGTLGLLEELQRKTAHQHGEEWGDVETAGQGDRQGLITLRDMCGDLHAHTKASDGKGTLEEMAHAARSKGYDYLAITDHSPSLTIARGLDIQRLAQQMEAIDRLNGRLEGFTLLKGSEVDILEDGSLDLPDDILAQLDLRVCSVHTGFKLSRERQTERILRAMDNPYFNILAHPTGRLVNKRPPYDVDIERVMQAALERGCFLEVNSQPKRLDLDETYCRVAKDMGLKLSISTDAHRVADLDYMRLGVLQARQGLLEADDVLNTRSLSALKQLLKR